VKESLRLKCRQVETLIGGMSRRTLFLCLIVCIAVEAVVILYSTRNAPILEAMAPLIIAWR
jgi:hypothetical protein